MTGAIPRELAPLHKFWLDSWEPALKVWSSFTKLGEPRWCFTKSEEKKEQLTDSFAMIRLDDHAVVISLRQIKELDLEKYSREILAHEIGHHVFTPADLRDNARLFARIRAGIPSRESYTAQISNLYTDLLINDRLYRDANLDMAGIYKKLKVENTDRLWTLYMRIYENLWNLPPGTLVSGKVDEQIQMDAQLGARVIRIYAKDWLDGAGRFAALCLPYLLDLPQFQKTILLPPWMDSTQAGAGDMIPDGLVEIDDGEIEGAIHPSQDERITGFDDEGDESSPDGIGQATIGGKKNNYRDPSQYRELMKAIGVKLSERDLVIRYYRERALPYLIKFPTREIPETHDPLPEGLDVWDIGNPISDVDWVESVIRSPHVIPGVTTVERVYGTSEGSLPEHQPLDLYLGVDCSGSMMNPAYNMSYPVLAGTIITLSALRTGAMVKVTLSGEPGKYSETDGFIRNEKEILNVLTGYLGTGYAFGVLRLKDTFLSGEKRSRPVHILIVTDSDIFHMLKEVKNGWEIAREALEAAGGGGTVILNMATSMYREQTDRLRKDGWNVHFVTKWEDLIAFAQAFSKTKYERERKTK